MNKYLLLVLLFTAPLYGQDFCTRSQNEVKSALSETYSRIAFKNEGGLINGGVCWWHSRLQRSSIYLARYSPELAPPGPSEVKEILRSLRMMDRPVVIPGFRDFQSFSKVHEKEIQKVLEVWQKRDGFLNFQWLRGISGKHSLGPLKMQERMEKVYHVYKNSPAPLWIMAQIKGITSHSFLVLDMRQTEKGYLMKVIDSNQPLKTLGIEYHYGDRHLRNDKYTFVPYTGFQNDFRLISEALVHACGEVLFNSEVEDGDIESGGLQY